MKPRSSWKRIARSAPPKRKGFIKPSSPMRSAVKKKSRTALEKRLKFAREFGSKERADFVCALPSVASGRGPCVNAHVIKGDGGMSRKASSTAIAPLTDYEHRVELHMWGPKTFEAHYGISLAACAADTERRWQSHLAALERTT